MATGDTVPPEVVEPNPALIQVYKVGVGEQLADNVEEPPKTIDGGVAVREQLGADGPLVTPQLEQVQDGLTVPSLQ